MSALDSLLAWTKKSKVRRPQSRYDTFVDGVLEAKKQVKAIICGNTALEQVAVIETLRRQLKAERDMANEYRAKYAEAISKYCGMENQRDAWHQNCDYWMNEAKIAANGNTAKAEIRMERWKARAVWWMKKARDAEGDNEDLGVEVRRLRGVLDASE